MDELNLTRQELEARTRELAEAKRRLEITLRELTHRSKNLLTVVQAIARQTASRSASMDEFLQSFGARLYAMGLSHDLLVADDWRGASLRTLVEEQLKTHAGSLGTRIAMEGDEIMLKPDAVHNLGLALHELTDNAERFGALSSPDGAIRIHWQICDDADALKLVWQETGGPPVEAPAHAGFGRAMLENVVGKALGGEVSLSFPANGARCEIVIPASHVTSWG